MNVNDLSDFDFSGFWNDSEYALGSYVDAPPDRALITSLEAELGYTLPASYIAMMQVHNGGIPFKTCCPTATHTSWAEDHAAITGFFSIGRDRPYSLGGEYGSRFWIEAWEYPDIGVVICDCPSAGHDLIMLDYRKCGPHGEPEVVHVDQEADFRVTFLAANFAEFVGKLVHEEEYDELCRVDEADDDYDNPDTPFEDEDLEDDFKHPELFFKQPEKSINVQLKKLLLSKKGLALLELFKKRNFI